MCSAPLFRVRLGTLISHLICMPTKPLLSDAELCNVSWRSHEGTILEPALDGRWVMLPIGRCMGMDDEMVLWHSYGIAIVYGIYVLCEPL